LLSRQAFVAASRPGAPATDVRLPPRGESAASILRTALCVETRHGRLHVFMPPTATLEDYLDCVTAVEDTAAALKTPVIIEGYPPPLRPAAQCAQGHPRSRRDRGQHASNRLVGRDGPADGRALRRGPARTAGHGEVHA